MIELETHDFLIISQRLTNIDQMRIKSATVNANDIDQIVSVLYANDDIYVRQMDEIWIIAKYIDEKIAKDGEFEKSIYCKCTGRYVGEHSKSFEIHDFELYFDDPPVVVYD